MKRRFDTPTLALAGLVACCGVSALLTAAVGTTLLGLGTEVWGVAVVALAVVAVHLSMRRAR